MTRRVYIVWFYPLFHETVRLLLDGAGIEVVGANSDAEAAHSAIEQLEPDTIIIEETDDAAPIDSQVYELLEMNDWGSRVVRLSLQDNELRLYHRERWLISDRDDLLKRIRG